MPRATIDLMDPADLSIVKAQWRFAPGLVPGEPNEGLVSQLTGSPARLPDYDDSGWEATNDLARWHSKGLTFAWYRIKITLPETVAGQDIRESRCLFETCIDDYGELWVDGECNRDRSRQRGSGQSYRPGPSRSIKLFEPLSNPRPTRYSRAQYFTIYAAKERVCWLS